MQKLLALATVPFLCLALPRSPAPAGIEAPADSLAAATYEVDGVHSSVVFKIKHAGATWFYGTFETVSGSLSLDEADPSKSKVEVEIDAASVDSNNVKRDGHLESPDFLSAKEFPSIEFQSTSVKKSGEGSFEVTGDLTFRGVTKSITVPVTHVGKGQMQGKQVAGYEASFSIERSDFGSTYGLDEGALGDEVFLTLSLEVVAP